MICCPSPAIVPTDKIHLDGSRQDKDRGVIPENHLQKVEPNAMAYSFAVKLGLKAAPSRNFKLSQIC